jgi:molybdenum cofactor synthesis domain-containing protein
VRRKEQSVEAHRAVIADPTASIILVGTELLRGQIRDTNRSLVTTSLQKIGIEIISTHLIRDNKNDISNIISYLHNRVTYLFTTGGLGPTADDITLEAIAAAFSVPVVSLSPADHQSYSLMSGSETARPSLRHTPLGAEVIETPHGPVVRTQNVYSLPGLPRLVRGRLPYILPMLAHANLHFRSFHVDSPQSRLALILEQAAKRYPSVEIGCYPSGPSTMLAFGGRDMAEIDHCVSFLKRQLEPNDINRT